MNTDKPKRNKGESAADYQSRLDDWLIERAFEEKAKHLMHQEGADRNKRWRIAEAERREELGDDYW